MKRESFKSRLGFLLIAAGCAIGIGNVWRFPYIAGNYGGGVFVLFYLIFLVILAVPVLTMELAIGRASRKSTVSAYNELEKPGQKWHIHGGFALAGNYLLMMFYTTVAGWMLSYMVKFIKNDFAGLDTAGVGQVLQRFAGKSCRNGRLGALYRNFRFLYLLPGASERSRENFQRYDGSFAPSDRRAGDPEHDA